MPLNNHILRHLSQDTGLRAHEMGQMRPDFGPVDATLMQQNIYGEWHEKQRCPLYLAPGWLLFDYLDPLRMRQVRRIEVIARSAGHILQPAWNERLLRIEYQDNLNKPQTVAYLTRHADALARKLSKQSSVPYQTAARRKKKAG